VSHRQPGATEPASASLRTVSWDFPSRFRPARADPLDCEMGCH